MAKNQASTKQHPEAELLLFEHYSHSSSTLSYKNKGRIPEKKKKNKCIHEIIQLIIMEMKMEMNNRSHR